MPLSKQKNIIYHGNQLNSPLITIRASKNFYIQCDWNKNHLNDVVPLLTKIKSCATDLNWDYQCHSKKGIYMAWQFKNLHCCATNWKIEVIFVKDVMKTIMCHLEWMIHYEFPLISQNSKWYIFHFEMFYIHLIKKLNRIMHIYFWFWLVLNNCQRNLKNIKLCNKIVSLFQ